MVVWGGWSVGHSKTTVGPLATVPVARRRELRLLSGCQAGGALFCEASSPGERASGRMQSKGGANASRDRLNCMAIMRLAGPKPLTLSSLACFTNYA